MQWTVDDGRKNKVLYCKIAKARREKTEACLWRKTKALFLAGKTGGYNMPQEKSFAAGAEILIRKSNCELVVG